MVTVPPDHACFDGHFDSNPVLPGVAQLAMVLEVCAAMKLGSGNLQGVENVRFSQPVLPGSACSITVRTEGAAGAAPFRISCGDQVVTTGTLIFR